MTNHWVRAAVIAAGVAVAPTAMASNAVPDKNGISSTSRIVRSGPVQAPTDPDEGSDVANPGEYTSKLRTGPGYTYTGPIGPR